jgi:hypothetical protein
MSVKIIIYDLALASFTISQLACHENYLINFMFFLTRSLALSL